MQPAQKLKGIKNIRPRPHVSKPARADAFFGSLKKHLLSWNQSSVYRYNYLYENWTLATTQLFKQRRSPERKGRFPRSLVGKK